MCNEKIATEMHDASICNTLHISIPEIHIIIIIIHIITFKCKEVAILNGPQNAILGSD